MENPGFARIGALTPYVDRRQTLPPSLIAKGLNVMVTVDTGRSGCAQLH